jgi:squalene-hopene/tetraprenyl-beta-curcumene cyclase
MIKEGFPMRLPILAWIVVACPLSGLCGDWSPRLAAEYLDSRQKAWFEWRGAAAPGGTCFSCHSGISYLLARPALKRALHEETSTSWETGLLSGLRTRVDKTEMKDLFKTQYKEPLASQALGVESIFAALFLTLNDDGAAKLSPEAERAFERMWSLQIRSGKAAGSWAWFNFDLDPWETSDAAFYGSAVAALATGSAPAEYRARPGIQERVNALTAYLCEEQKTQPLHNRLMLLWASAKLPGVMTESERKVLIEDTLGKQQADGGWTMESLGPWKQRSTAPVSTGSNSYATAFVALVLEKAGAAHSNPGLLRSLEWLKSHQNREFGYWAADSMNKHYEPGSMPLEFLRDAATGFAALALIESGERR